MTDHSPDPFPQGSIPQVLEYMQHKLGCRERLHAWVKRPGQVGVYDCKQCGSWTANKPLYRKELCVPSEPCTCGLDALLTALRSLASPKSESTT